MNMIKSQKRYWDDLYKRQSNPPSCDDWLENHLSILLSAKNIVELGCGHGSNTLYLYKQNILPIACDFSDIALSNIKKYCPEINTECFDIQNGLPFYDHSIDVVIADLCLHYFTWNITNQIINDISRILTSNGYLIGRVNSVKDFNFGAMSGERLEKNYYYYNGCTKRFFDYNELIQLFDGWDLLHIKESTTNKYGNVKSVYEFCLKKKHE